MCTNLDGEQGGIFIDGNTSGPQGNPTIDRMVGFGHTPMGGITIDFSILNEDDGEED